MADLDDLEIFSISLGSLLIVISLILCCSAACLACCGGAFTPLCCWSGWILACCSWRDSSYRTIGDRNFTTITVIPPPPVAVAPYHNMNSRSYPVIGTVVEERSGPSQAYHSLAEMELSKGTLSGTVEGVVVEGSAPPAPLASLPHCLPPSDASLPHHAPSSHGHAAHVIMADLHATPPPQTSVPRDWGFLALFLLHACFLITLALSLGLPSLGFWGHALVDDASRTAPLAHSPETIAVARNLLCLAAGLGLVANVLSFVWLGFMLNLSTALITSTVFLSIMSAALLALLSLLSGHLIGCFLFASLAVAGLCLLREDPSRVLVSSSILGTACRAVAESRNLFGAAYLLMALQFLWVVIWAVAATGVYTTVAADSHGNYLQSGRQYGAGQKALLGFFLLFSLYWGAGVCQNTLRCTVVGAVAAWWYVPGPARDSVSLALARATGPSLGSVCKGSLAVSLIETCRASLRGLGGVGLGGSERRPGCCPCCLCPGCCLCGCRWVCGCVLDYLLGCVEAAWRAFNRFAFVFVGVWGYPYGEAARLALRLFETRGWEVILNDYLIGNVLFLGCMLMGGVTAFLGVMTTRLLPEAFEALPASATFVGLAGFLIGMGNCLLFVSVVSSAVDTVFVCFAASPYVLQTNRPAEYAHLRHVFDQGRERGIVVDVGCSQDGRGERVPLNVAQVSI